MTPVSHLGINIINESGITRKVFLLSILVLLISMKGLGQLTAEFVASSTNICSGSIVTFTDKSSGISDSTSYTWNFGTGASPSITTGKGPHNVNYTGSGKSTVSLTIKNGTTVTKTKTDYISVNPLPQAPVVSVDCSAGLNEAVVNITSPLGEGFEYKLDGGSYRSAASFTDVINGSHTITVRNASGCTATGNYFDVSCGCPNGATVNLSSTSGATCNITPVTVSGNTFGGIAGWVTISENGEGSVSPSITSNSPFSFTYTPKTKDAGNVVIITVTTNNPTGTACVAAKRTYFLTVNGNPPAPVIRNIIQPSCSEQTASVKLDGLPEVGSWILERTPGDITTTGYGTSTTIINMVTGRYTYTVTSEAGCISKSSDDVVISSQPTTPNAPEIGNILHPTCTVSTGSVELKGLPASGTWTLTRNPGGVKTSGSGTSKTLSGLSSGIYSYTVTNSAGCTSVASSSVVINSQPLKPAAPIAGTIMPPTCTLSRGSVVLNGLPVAGSWTMTRYPGTVILTGTGPSSTISDLSAGVYNFTLTDATGCASDKSADIVIPAQPATPTAPKIGSITFPTCTMATGSVLLSGLPASGTWTLTLNPGEIKTTGTGTSKTISDLSSGTYNFTVTNAAGCNSVPSSQVTIPLHPGIPVLIITNPAAVCSPRNIDLTTALITAGSTPGLSFTYWTNINATKPFVTPSAASGGTYYIKGTTAEGCFDVKPVLVVVDSVPTANAGTDQVLEYEFVTTLDASLTNDFETGTWSIISGAGEFADNTYSKTSVNGLSPDKNEFLWTVTRGVCPPSFDTVMIIVHDLELRTLITPNMDGRNDYFKLRGLKSLGKTELVIFDRRGAEVYKNDNYDNLWNGVDYNGKPLPEDTYFYFLKSENGKSDKGFIVIRR